MNVKKVMRIINSLLFVHSLHFLGRNLPDCTRLSWMFLFEIMRMCSFGGEMILFQTVPPYSEIMRMCSFGGEMILFQKKRVTVVRTRLDLPDASQIDHSFYGQIRVCSKAYVKIA